VRAEILDAIAQEAPAEDRRRTMEWAPARWFKKAAWQRVAAVVVLALAATLLVWRWGLMPGAGEAVYAAVAADHAAHCSAEVMMGAVTDPDALDRLIRASAKITDLPDLSAFGYGNPRGRVCKINGVEFLHLVYYHAAQPPISLFLRPQGSSLITERLTALHSGSFNVVSVSQAGVDLLVVSSLTAEQTSSIARAIASRL
jgi:hypothetical protein